MEIRRSQSGNLTLGPTVLSRALSGLGAVSVAAQVIAWLWVQVPEGAQWSVRAVLLFGAIGIALFAFIGGPRMLRVLIGEEFLFDGRRQEVRLNGRRLCGYEEVLELRIVVWTRTNRAGQTWDE